jgi:hypothetical protein
MNELSKISTSELEYHRVVIEQKQTADLLYTHWVLYLKRKYNIKEGGGITETGELVN